MTLSLALTLIGILYGFILISAAFIKGNRFTEAMRADKLIFPSGASESSRPINLILGIVVLAYYGWLLYSEFFTN